MDTFTAQAALAKSAAVAEQQMARVGGHEGIRSSLAALFTARAVDTTGNGDWRTFVGHKDITDDLRRFENGPMAHANALARARRAAPRRRDAFRRAELLKSNPALAKAAMDIGTLTNLADVVGGQAMGYVSIDYQMARQTIRPNSFTLYNCLKKTRANQVVDFWPVATQLGGALPGAAFNSYGSQTSALVPNAGSYEMKNIQLKLAYDTRAITMALGAQNSFVDVAAQESANAALSIMSSLDWAGFYGNSAIYPNQFDGLLTTITNNAPAANVVDFQKFAAANSSRGWTNEQALLQLLFEQTAQINSYGTFGIPTHVFMDPAVAASLSTLPSTLLNQVLGLTGSTPIAINGDLQGINTRFGDLQFPVDILLNARDLPAQASSAGTASNPTPPASVTVAASGTATGSDWTSAYTTGGNYRYAVASMDAFMNESNLTWASATGIATGGAYVLTINPPGANDAHAYRVYRSGMGYAGSDPTLVRFIGEVLANGSNAVTFVDLNTQIPGASTLFLLDMDEQDDALDYRYLLPMSKIDLFQNQLNMPWAIATIGALRVRIPTFHGIIKNFVPSRPTFDPLSPNT